MKQMVAALLILVATNHAFSQIREGKNNELSISGSYQNISSSGSGHSQSALLISPRIGFFVTGGLEIEPEAIVMIGSGVDFRYVLNANVAYNVISGANGVPFLLIGYGYSNTVPVFGIPATSPDYGLWVLNLGAGMKAFLAENVALRLEYRFQKFNGSGETAGSGYYTYTPETDMTIHIVQFGLSILL